MIIRRSRNKEKAKSTSLSFMLEYGPADVREILRDWYKGAQAAFAGLYSPEKAKELALIVHTATEQDWRSDFAGHPYFAHYPGKYRDMFAEWAFALALRDGLLIPSASDPGKYYISNNLPAHVGRPPKRPMS